MWSIVNQLFSMKMVLDDELQALLLFNSLSDNWETLMVSLSNSVSDGVVTMNQVTWSLLNEKTRRKSLGSALVTENRGRNKSRKPHKREKSRGRSKSIKEINCYNCSKPGHFKKVCQKLKKEKKKRVKKKPTLLQMATLLIFSDCEKSCLCLTCQDTDWAMKHRYFMSVFNMYRSRICLGYFYMGVPNVLEKNKNK